MATRRMLYSCIIYFFVYTAITLNHAHNLHFYLLVSPLFQRQCNRNISQIKSYAKQLGKNLKIEIPRHHSDTALEYIIMVVLVAEKLYRVQVMPQNLHKKGV